MFRNVVTIAGILTLGGSPLLADFTYQETSTITGGAMASMMRLAGVFSKQAREPIQSTVSVKGDRMMHRSATHVSVIDLGSQTITSIDMQKKQYSVMTFDEMKQMIEQMSQKMKQNDKGEMTFKVSANATGKTKQVAGFDAKEMVLTMEMEAKDKESGQKGGMTVITDMWLAPGIAGYQEVRDFYKRMAEKINWTPGGNMFMQNPQVSQGMAEVYKEVSKVDGVPVQQIITMGAAGTRRAGGRLRSSAAAATARRGSPLRRRRPRRSARWPVRPRPQEVLLRSTPAPAIAAPADRLRIAARNDHRAQRLLFQRRRPGPVRGPRRLQEGRQRTRRRCASVC